MIYELRTYTVKPGILTYDKLASADDKDKEKKSGGSDG